MFGRQFSRISEGLRRVANGDASAADDVASALCAKDQKITTDSAVEITRCHPRNVRAGIPHGGAVRNMPPMPMPGLPGAQPAALRLNVQDDGGGNERGECGAALHIRNGVLRNEGESWVLPWAQIQSIGTYADDRRSELDTSLVTSTYHYARCYRCSDSKGRDVDSDKPICIWSVTPVASSWVGKSVTYFGDAKDGSYWMICPSPGESAWHWGKASTGWEWESGQVGEVGYAPIYESDDIYGTNVGSSTTRVYVRATSVHDPNIQKDDIIAYQYDDSAAAIKVSLALDDKIGTVKAWSKSLASVQGGWAVWATIGGLFPVGYEAGGDYDPAGTTGGSHPIRPKEHDDSESTSTTDTWCSTWRETAWKLDDHPEKDTLASTTGVTVNEESLSSSVLVTVPITVQATSLGTSSSQALTVTGSGTSGGSGASVTGSVSLTTASVEIDDHSPHTHTIAVTTLPSGDGSGHTYVVTDNTGEESHALTHSYTAHTHTATFSAGQAASHTHSVDFTEAAIDPASHTHGMKSHSHTATGSTTITVEVSHDHDITDPTHAHTVTSYSHSGSLWHREEDYRPPWLSVIYIKRVGPEND